MMSRATPNKCNLNTGSREAGPCQSSRREETERSQDGESEVTSERAKGRMPKVSVR